MAINTSVSHARTFICHSRLSYDVNIACQSCPTGYQPNADQNACVFCERGEYTSKDQTSCKKCDANQYVTNETLKCQFCEGLLNTPTMHQDDCELNVVSVLVIFLCLGSPIAMFSAIVNGAYVFFLFLLLGLPAVAMFVYWKKRNTDETNKDGMDGMDDMDDMEEYETFGEFYEKRCCSCCIKWHDRLILGGIMLMSLILLGFVGIVLFGYWHCYKEVNEYTEKVETIYEFYKTRLAYICYGRCCVQEERIVIETEMVVPTCA